MTNARISGTLAAAPTPLRDGGEQIDADAFEPLLEFYAASGLDGLLVLGTTGEGILLRSDERRWVTELVLAKRGPLRVVVHCGAQTTAETSALAAHAAQAGADGVAVIAPPYYALTADELVNHFAAAAAACSPLPFYVYEYADRSGYAVGVDVVERLRERVSNLVGMKVSDAPFDRVAPYLTTGLDVFIGAEGVVAEGMARGAVGAVSGVAAAFPELVSALVADPVPERAVLVKSVRSVLSAQPSQASVKSVLGLRGLPVRPDVRAPLRPLAAGATSQLRSQLERLLGVDALSGVVRL